MVIIDTLVALSKMSYVKDAYLARHHQGVCYYSTSLAAVMDIPSDLKRVIYRAALLHDIGKIGIPNEILLKPGKLTPKEWEVMKLHPLTGSELLKSEHIEVVKAVRYHHEHWDGSGYPEGLTGEGIPLAARIIALADALDAMTSDRPYRKAMFWEKAVKEIKQCAGTQFDPQVVQAFLFLISLIFLNNHVCLTKKLKGGSNMSVKEVQVCQLPQKKNVVAVDVGYGYTKAVSSSGKRICFPSMISPARELPLAELADNSIGHKVVISKEPDQVEKYFVGELAIREGNSVHFTLDDVKHKHPAHDIVLLTATAILGPEGINRLVVGLPVDYYRKQSKSLKEHLYNMHAKVSVDDRQEVIITFEEILVYPQGAGALLTVEDIPGSGIVALVDVGHKTTDCVALEFKNGPGRPVQSMCVSVETGILNVQKAVSEEFLQRTGTRPPAGYMDQIMRQGRIWFRGKELDLSEVIKEKRHTVARSIIDGILAAWGDRADFVRRVYLAGGGALELPELVDMFPGASVVPDTQFANALGFLKFGEN